MPEGKIEKTFEGKNIVITGGLGSIGSAIVKGLLGYGVKSIKVVDNRETELFYANREKKDDRLSYCFADVKDKDSMRYVMRGKDIIFHAAAMKHVVICETHPAEAIKTNIIGTKNLIELSIENEAEKMILISTDKAINPEGVMGTTKLLAERMISAINSMDIKTKAKFGAVRFGNVLYSRGSVLEIWDEQVKQGEKITVTNPEMTRFVMGIPESVELIFTAASYANKSEVFVMKMPACSIGNLAKAYLELKGLSADQYVLTGLTKGEKMHESLLSSDEQDFLLENDKFFLKMPLNFEKARENDLQYYQNLGFEKSKENSFCSSDPRYALNKEEVKKILMKFQSS